MIHKLAAAALACVLSFGMVACEREGPAERVGEEVDEAADTVRQGAESAANEADDAMDRARENAEDAADEARDNR